MVPHRLRRSPLVGCSYVITAVEQGKAEITNSFLLTGTSEDDKKFEDEAIEIAIAASADHAPHPSHLPNPLPKGQA